VIAHWDEVEPYRVDRNHIHGEWTDLGRAAGTIGVGLRRIRLAPGEIPTPEHMHPVEEEIFFTLDGSGVSRQDGKTYDIRADRRSSSCSTEAGRSSSGRLRSARSTAGSTTRSA
jgi:uncharacterized cupin superfamily protein